MGTYRVVDPVPEVVAEALALYHPFAQQLLYRRGITDANSATQFFTPTYEGQLHDPFLLHDMEKAVERILQAFANQQHITIFSDYDCDGIPGGVVLHDFFKMVGHEAFTNHIPHRHYEGFGLSVEAVEKIAATGSKLIITVDCGTTSTDALERAQELEVDVVVTDHHQPPAVLPPTAAIVNPQLGDYPFRGLCGAAVAYKVVQALIMRGDFKLVPGQEKWLLDMVGIATIADMVPLVDENRVFAHYGLLVLRKTRRPGLLELFRKQRLDVHRLSEDDIGFTIGPRINAASRMDTPEDAFHMLSATDEVVAAAKVAHLERLNNERKGVVAAMTKEAHKHLSALESVPAVIVLGSPSWRPSLVGLVANTLAQEHGRPAFVWGRDGNGILKGSCRSGGSANVHALMEAASEHFIEHGGHHFSGGFSVHDEHIHTLSDALQEAFASLSSDDLVAPELVVEFTCSADMLTSALLRAQQQFAPFGKDNERPLLAIEVEVSRVELFGKTKEHTKLQLKTRGVAKEAIAFFKKPEQFTVVPEAGKTQTLLAYLEVSYFMRREQVRLRIVDVV